MKHLSIIFLALAFGNASAQVQQPGGGVPIPSGTVLGNSSGGAAVPSALTASTTNTLLLAPALLAIGGTADDTAAVQAVIATVPATNGVLKFSPGVVYKIGAAGLHFTNYTNLEVDFNGAQFQALADTTQQDTAGSFVNILFTNCTNCKVHGGNFDGKAFKGATLGFQSSTDDEIYSNYSIGVGSAGDRQFSSHSSTRMRWHDNTVIGAVVFFNGTITGASTTTATLTVNSTASGVVAINQVLFAGVQGTNQTTTITSGTLPTFTLTCSVACVNVSAVNMTAIPPVYAVRGFWLGNGQSGKNEIDLIIGPNNKAIGNTATGFALQSVGAQVFGNYALNNQGAGFISSTSTGSQSVNHNFVGNTAIGNAFHGYQTDPANSVPVLRVTLSGNRFEGNANSCMQLNLAQWFTVTGNLCINNDVAAIPIAEIGVLGNSSLISIVGNMIKVNSNANDTGINLVASSGNTITDVAISSNNISCAANNVGNGILANTSSSSTIKRVAVANNIVATCNNGLVFRATSAGDTYDDLAVIGNTAFDIASTFFIRFSSSTAGQMTNARVIGNSGSPIQTDTNTPLQANFGNSWNVSQVKAPTISSGFGTSPSVTLNVGSGLANVGYSGFSVNVGTGGAASSGVIGLPTAVHGWACSAADVTTPTGNLTQQTASSTTTATFTNYVRTTGVAGAWPASDILQIQCSPN